MPTGFALRNSQYDDDKKKSGIVKVPLSLVLYPFVVVTPGLSELPLQQNLH
jgi:hypothetical protein